MELKRLSGDHVAGIIKKEGRSAELEQLKM